MNTFALSMQWYKSGKNTLIQLHRFQHSLPPLLIGCIRKKNVVYFKITTKGNCLQFCCKQPLLEGKNTMLGRNHLPVWQFIDCHWIIYIWQQDVLTMLECRLRFKSPEQLHKWCPFENMNNTIVFPFGDRWWGENVVMKCFT